MCGSPPSAPQLPQFPGLTPQEQDILSKEGLTLDQFNQMIQGTGNTLAQNKNILQQISGLYDAQGNLDQAALTDLKARSQGQLAQAQGVGSAAMGYLQSYFGGTNTSGGSAGPPGSTTSATGVPGVAQAQSAAYLQALQGTGAINEATKQRQQRDFMTLKDSLAQRGIMVTGDTPEQATSDSTAGQRAIQLFQQNVQAENSSERLGYINTLGSQVAGTVGAAGGAAGAGFGATGTQLGYTSSAATSIPATLSPLLTNYQSSLGSLYQPYQTQQLGPYQQALDQAQMNYTAGLNQYNASQNQLMGWANLGSRILFPSSSSSSGFNSGPGGTSTWGPQGASMLAG